LVYVIVAFTDITGQTFRAVAQARPTDRGWRPPPSSTWPWRGHGRAPALHQAQLWLLTAIFLPLVYWRSGSGRNCRPRC